MRNTLILMIFSVLLLAACGSPPAVQTPPPTQAPQVVEAQPTATNQSVSPTETPMTEAPASTEPPPTEAPAASATVVYKLVPGESQLQYEVGEVFINENNRFNTAVGVTPQVAGEITVDLSAPQNSSLGTITADISQFKSDSGRRDNAIRTRFLESERYPTVTFVPTQVEGLPSTYTEGQEIPLKISGDLTIRDVTKPVTFDAVVKLQGDSLTGQATTTILMSDFGFGPISIGGILNTEDETKVTLVLVARP
jgi:polyisoprenoid-binding protein YceI